MGDRAFKFGRIPQNTRLGMAVFQSVIYDQYTLIQIGNLMPTKLHRMVVAMGVKLVCAEEAPSP